MISQNQESTRVPNEGTTTRNAGDDKTWQKNGPSQIVLDSIFAALAAVLVAVVIGDSLPAELKYLENKLKFVELLLSLSAFFLFAMSAEGTTNALDEKDVRKYVYYLLWYNLAVIFLGSALGVFIAAHFLQHLISFCQALAGFVPVRLLDITIPMAYVISFGGFLSHWTYDVYWLLSKGLFSKGRIEFSRYLKELTDEVQPEADHSCLMKAFYKSKRFMKILPHHGVYTRLQVSHIHGIGVFAIRDIPRGTYVFSEDNEAIVWVDKKDVERLPKPARDLYDDFSIIRGGKYGCPDSFDKLTTSWYLNHSDEPNVAADHEYKFYALRDIKAGEELTANYRTYSERPKGASLS